MSQVHAEPTPLHEPLPGGTQRASVTVEPLIAGRVHWPSELMERPGGRLERLTLLRALLGSTDETVPTPAFLIRHPSAGAIVVDTGLHPSITSDPAQNFGRLAVRLAKPELGPGEDVPAQLRARGIEPSQVPIVVMTHLHFDHASAISEFPQSTFVVSEAEWEAATTDSRPSLRGYRPSHYDYAFDYRTVDFDRPSVESYSTFGRSFDLLGDGSIRLVYTPGHSAGHMSVVARLSDRPFVIGGDAIYTEGQLEGAPLPPQPVDEHRFRRSLQELKLFRREHPKAIITPGHDSAFYERLDELYE